MTCSSMRSDPLRAIFAFECPKKKLTVCRFYAILVHIARRASPPPPAHQTRAEAVVQRRYTCVTSPCRAAPAAVRAHPAAALWHAVDGVHIDASASVLRYLKLAISSMVAGRNDPLATCS